MTTLFIIYAVLRLCVLAHVAVANVEKIIFTGPPPSRLLSTYSTFASLHVHALTEDESSVHTELGRLFPSVQSGLRGQSSWILLANLTENQRYELRVCWSALEPTSFNIEAFTLESVLESPALIKSINAFSASSASKQANINKAEMPASTLADDSSLLVEIQAAADYYTDDKELMANPPTVLVDIILDPFLFNVFPKSLVPTIGYLILVGIAACFVARRITAELQSIASPSENQAKKQS